MNAKMKNSKLMSTKKRTGNGKTNSISKFSGLSTALRTAASRAKPFGRTAEVDSIRGWARACGRSLAYDFDRYWDLSKTAKHGPIQVIDMFSGCGGMSAGFQAVNGLLPAFRLAGAVDIDDLANQSYAKNLSVNPYEGDISEIAASRSEMSKMLKAMHYDPGEPLILIGCAPCQGFSSHRNTSSGFKDGRNYLFIDFARIAAKLKPDALIIENVPELLTNRSWPFVEQAKKILSRAGYRLFVTVHNMAEYGVPQERFRAVILGLRKNFHPIEGPFRRGEFRTVRDAIGKLPIIPAGGKDDRDPMHYTVGHKESTIATIMAVPKDGGSRPPDVGPACLRRAHAKNGRAAYEDVYGRLAWDKPAITITAHARNPASGRFSHPEQDRGLSVREGALLQGFPSDYWFAGSLDDRFRQIGNAVPPIFAASAAIHILSELANEEASVEKFISGIERPVGPSFSRMIPALKAGHRTERDFFGSKRDLTV